MSPLQLRVTEFRKAPERVPRARRRDSRYQRRLEPGLAPTLRQPRLHVSISLRSQGGGDPPVWRASPSRRRGRPRYRKARRVPGGCVWNHPVGEPHGQHSRSSASGCCSEGDRRAAETPCNTHGPRLKRTLSRDRGKRLRNHQARNSPAKYPSASFTHSSSGRFVSTTSFGRVISSNCARTL